jgi:cellulose synthase/poly-beta-1,6-N-acetylglucosamine synthase-like glycosyltransferase
MVTLLISAYNEEESIEAKISNSLDLRYPSELLEIVVVSDGSTDRTDEIVSRYAEQGVVLRRFEGRIGKSACLNQAVQQARGDIVVFSDANSQYGLDAIAAMADHLSDPGIGFVTGHTQYVKTVNGKTVDAVGLYAKIERWTKRYESQISSCVGADGAIFAIRRELFHPLRAEDINDLVIPLHVVRAGFRGTLADAAVCRETLAERYGDEFRRQARIATRTILAVWNNRDLLNPARAGLFAFQVLSHKVAKLLVPFFLIAAAMSNIYLAAKSGFYQAMLVGQVGVYVLALAADSLRSESLPGRIASLARTFLLQNAGVLLGWANFLTGRRYTTWSSATRGKTSG